MLLFRLIFFLFLGLLGRRVYRAFKPRGRRGPSDRFREGRKPETTRAVDDMTEQDISDADFEEIP